MQHLAKTILSGIAAIILLIIFWPNFIKRDPQNICISHLRQFAGAKEQWAFDNNKIKGDFLLWNDLVGDGRYLKTTPVCPEGGNYSLNPMGEPPTCSIGTNAATPHLLEPFAPSL